MKINFMSTTNKLQAKYQGIYKVWLTKHYGLLSTSFRTSLFQPDTSSAVAWIGFNPPLSVLVSEHAEECKTPHGTRPLTHVDMTRLGAQSLAEMAIVPYSSRLQIFNERLRLSD